MPDFEEMLTQNQIMTFYGFASNLREEAVKMLGLVKKTNEDAYNKDCCAKDGLINLFDELISFVTKGDFSKDFDVHENYDDVFDLFLQVRKTMLKGLERQKDLTIHLFETKDAVSKVLNEQEREYLVLLNIIRERFSIRLKEEMKK